MSAGPIWSHLAPFSGLLHGSRQNRKLRKQLIFYDFSVEPKARQGRAFPSHGRGPRFDPLCVHQKSPDLLGFSVNPNFLIGSSQIVETIGLEPVQAKKSLVRHVSGTPDKQKPDQSSAP